MNRPARASIAVLLLIALATAALGDERLRDVACRSVHLRYKAPAATAFYNEITVEQSAPGTYFAVCGWDKGYYGIQELGNGKKLLIFSVWDSGQNDPKAVAEDQRVKLLHKDDKTRIGRFGGEGTGGQSFFDYDWNIGDTYRFMVTAKPAGDRTEYAAHFYHPEEKAWKHLVTFSTITGGRNLGGYYSFVEDFKRDRVSATKPRSARFGNTWVKPVSEGQWHPATEARFTADSNAATNVDAAAASDGRFRLATGADTKNTGTKLGESITLPPESRSTPPQDLPAPP